MATELPKYRIHAATVINGILIRCAAGPEDVVLAGQTPRNSWEPLNESAREAFRRRDAAKLAVLDDEIREVEDQIKEAQTAGAQETELEGFRKVLSEKRLARAVAPRALKAVPSFGGGRPTHSLVFNTPIPEGEASGKSAIFEDRLERMVQSAIAGGASEADVAELREAIAAKSKPVEVKPSLGSIMPPPPKAEKPRRASDT